MADKTLNSVVAQHIGSATQPDDTLESYSGAEPFLVGLTPYFWAHVPLLVKHFSSLKLINGINFLLMVDDEQKPCKLLPVSKVTLVGTIVCAERRSNNSVIYVVDDGTGLVDCLHWLENPFSVPSLTGYYPTVESMLPVGSLVKIMGRIDCLSIHPTEKEEILINGQRLESLACVREIHSNIVQILTSLDIESRHWLACQSLLKSNMNSVDVLKMLGPEIQSYVDDRRDLPETDDVNGEWRLFGTKCQCRVNYKKELLYCHCQATGNPLDPLFHYRDSLLERLVALEDEVANNEPLRIQYKTLANDNQLNAKSCEILGSSGDPRRLLTSTIRALRKDGILFLLCSESDTYFLISVKRVLTPYVRKLTTKKAEAAWERAALVSNPPKFLSCVPKSRIELVKRMVFHDDKRKALALEPE